MRIAFLFLLFAAHCSAQSDTTIRIYFDFASWEPKNDPFRNLDTNKWEKRVVLLGKTDTVGAEQYNLYLADARIKSTQALLARQTYFVSGSAKAVGESYALPKKYTPQKERCVEVQLYRKERAATERMKDNPFANAKQSPFSPARNRVPETAERLPRTFHPDSAMVQGDVFILRNIEFIINETVVTLESYPELQLLAKVMKEHPTMHIHIKGHVCCAPAQSLSYQRAMKVYTYLVSNGIEPERMTYEGYSNKLPNPEAKNDLYSQAHRRVEIEVIKE